MGLFSRWGSSTASVPDTNSNSPPSSTTPPPLRSILKNKNNVSFASDPGVGDTNSNSTASTTPPPLQSILKTKNNVSFATDPSVGSSAAPEVSSQSSRNTSWASRLRNSLDKFRKSKSFDCSTAPSTQEPSVVTSGNAQTFAYPPELDHGHPPIPPPSSDASFYSRPFPRRESYFQTPPRPWQSHNSFYHPRPHPQTSHSYVPYASHGGYPPYPWCPPHPSTYYSSAGPPPPHYVPPQHHYSYPSQPPTTQPPSTTPTSAPPTTTAPSPIDFVTETLPATKVEEIENTPFKYIEETDGTDPKRIIRRTYSIAPQPGKSEITTANGDKITIEFTPASERGAPGKLTANFLPQGRHADDDTQTQSTNAPTYPPSIYVPPQRHHSAPQTYSSAPGRYPPEYDYVYDTDGSGTAPYSQPAPPPHSSAPPTSEAPTKDTILDWITYRGSSFRDPKVMAAYERRWGELMSTYYAVRRKLRAIPQIEHVAAMEQARKLINERSDIWATEGDMARRVSQLQDYTTAWSNSYKSVGHVDDTVNICTEMLNPSFANLTSYRGRGVIDWATYELEEPDRDEAAYRLGRCGELMGTLIEAARKRGDEITAAHMNAFSIQATEKVDDEMWGETFAPRR